MPLLTMARCDAPGCRKLVEIHLADKQGWIFELHFTGNAVNGLRKRVARVLCPEHGRGKR